MHDNDTSLHLEVILPHHVGSPRQLEILFRLREVEVLRPSPPVEVTGIFAGLSWSTCYTGERKGHLPKGDCLGLMLMSV